LDLLNLTIHPSERPVDWSTCERDSWVSPKRKMRSWKSACRMCMHHVSIAVEMIVDEMVASVCLSVVGEEEGRV
jgi:hypothetical protein